ncbi:MAG TPA: hypothetical protein DCZ95_15820 [Verrucomicrobia bacterium]|nr:hypothetical protein [Verrucomicrobiota bacterium]
MIQSGKLFSLHSCFSNHWKNAAKKFQSLENASERLPILGKAVWSAQFFAWAFLLSASTGWAVNTMNLRGDVNGWAPTAMTKTSGVFRVTVQESAAGPRLFKFDEDGDWDPQWGNGDEPGLAALDTLYANGDNGSYTAVNSYRYTFTVKDCNGGENTLNAIQQTTNEPVGILSVSDNSGLIGNGPVSVAIQTSGDPSGERIYVRYTTNTWASSSFVEATGSGTNWSAGIPAQEPGAGVIYYILTTTFAAPTHADADVQTIAYGNNGGANYAYTQPSAEMIVLGTNLAAIANGEAAAAAKGTLFIPLVAGRAATNWFSVTNSGGTAFSIAGVETNGTGRDAFAISDLQFAIEAGTASNFCMVFSSAAAGTHTAAVALANTTTNSPYILYVKGSAYGLSTNVGPYAGGNAITITNGDLGTATNVLVGGVAASIQDAGPDWVTIAMPPSGSAGAKDIVIQTSDNGDTTLSGAYTYNPAGEIVGPMLDDWTRWENAPSLPSTLSEMASVVFSNKIYCMGGKIGTVISNRVYSFDGTNWSTEPALPTNRYAASAAVLNDHLYFIGGALGSENCSNIFRFNGSSWTQVQWMSQGRAYFSAGTISNAIYTIGGSYNGNATTNVFRYDVTNWTGVAGLPSNTARTAGGVLNDSLYLVGGCNTTPYYIRTNVFRYDGATVSEVAGLSQGRMFFAAAELGGYLYALGGVNFMSITCTNVFRFNGTAWTEVAGLPAGRRHNSAVTFRDQIYCIGGWNGASVSNVYRYPARIESPAVSPSSGVWTGGYPVVIIGTNLGNGADVTNVMLCGVSVQSIVSQCSTQIVVIAGASDGAHVGVGDVRIDSVSFGAIIRSNVFTYLAPDIQVTGASFDCVPVGFSVTNLFAATNAGTLPLSIASWTNAGAGAAYFTLRNPPSGVATGASVTFEVVFQPDVVGTFTPTGYTVNNSPDPNYAFGLSGSACEISPLNGPSAGGNSITITNVTLGSGSDITNVLVAGAAATITGQGANWIAIAMPAHTNGAVDIAVQSASEGETLIRNAYRYNPTGSIGSYTYDWTRWQSVVALPERRMYVGVGVWDDQLYVVGGRDGGATGKTNVYRFNETNWVAVNGLPAGRNENAVQNLNGTLYSVGGATSGTYMTNVYRFSGATWTEVRGLPAARGDMAVGVASGKLYVAGGYGSTVHSNVYYFDGDNWTETKFLPVRRYLVGGGVLDGAFYVIGGTITASSGYTNVYRFDGANWTEAAGLPAARRTMGVGVIHGALYVYGGMDTTTPLTNAYRFDGTSWTEIPGLPAGRFGLGSAAFNDQLYAIGGYGDSAVQTNVYRYPYSTPNSGVVPSSGSWTGGYDVVLLGRNLGGGSDITNVTVCGVPASIQSQSSTQVVIRVGTASSATQGSVRVYSVSYGETVRADAFTYEAVDLQILGSNGVVIASGEAATQDKGTDFGAMNLGAAMTNTLAIANTGNGLLTLSSVTTNGAGAGRFRMEAMPGTIEQGTQAEFRVVFDAAAVGTHTAAVHIVSDGLTSPYVVYLAGTVIKQDQSIAFNELDDQATTGQVGLAATASSGLAASFAVGSGPASIADGTNLSFTGAGAVSIVASQAGDANWNPAPDVTNAFNVTKATAGVTLNNLSQAYDGTPRVVTATTVPGALTVDITYDGSATAPTAVGGYAVTGVVNDVMYQGSQTGTLVVSKGAASVYLQNLSQVYDGSAKSVTATTMPAGLTVEFTYAGNAWAPTNAGTYAVTGTVNDASWQGDSNDVLTINQASQTISFPAIPDQLATNTVGLAATATSGFTVAFVVGSGPAVISDGTNLSFTSTGSVSVVASQAGDANWNPAPDVTNAFMVHAIPAVGPVTLQRATNQIMKVTDLMLLTNSVDPENSALSVVWVSPSSTNGGTVILNGRWITYTPPAGDDSADYFQFRVRNVYGGVGEGRVSVLVFSPSSEEPTKNIVSVTPSGSDILVRFVGIPGRNYNVQATTNLVVPSWSHIGTCAIGGQGYVIFTDTNPPVSRYYRTTRPE